MKRMPQRLYGRQLYVGSGFAFSKLALADERNGDLEEYILHPCMVDGALQTVVGIAAGR